MESDQDNRGAERKALLLTLGIVAWIIFVLVINYIAYRHRDPVPIADWERENAQRFHIPGR